MQCRTKTVVVGRGRMACGVHPSQHCHVFVCGDAMKLIVIAKCPFVQKKVKDSLHWVQAYSLYFVHAKKENRK